MNLQQSIRRKASEDFADILLTKQMNIETSPDGKYITFPNAVIRDEYDRRRRERRRENERLREGVPSNCSAANGHKERVRQTASYNFKRIPRRPAR